MQAQEKLQMHTDALQQLKSSCAALAACVRAPQRVVLTRRSPAGINTPRSPLIFRSAATLALPLWRLPPPTSAPETRAAFGAKTVAGEARAERHAGRLGRIQARAREAAAGV